MSSTPLHTGSRVLVLASASEARARMLGAAGLAFERDPAQVDEESALASMEAEGMSGRDAAVALAELKARRVSARHSGAFCIGADQTLSIGGRIFSKPDSLDDARDHLRALRGQRHDLHSAAVVAVDGQAIWRHADTARLWMRGFTDEFLESYLQATRDVTATVGCYRLEEEGAQLFDRVSGDWFTILGMPLLPLLAFLRDHGEVPR